MQTMAKRLRKAFLLILVLVVMLPTLLAGCGGKKPSVLIYTSSEDFKIESMTAALNEKFPDYDITVEYVSTGDHAAKLLAEGEKTACDITHDLDYGYLAKLDANGILADLSAYDKAVYMDDTNMSQNYIVELRNSGAIIVNTDVLSKKGLPTPASYEDLLNPAYQNLISMPNPKASGTGFMFLKSLVNAWGEEKAFDYFGKLNSNIQAYTSSGSGPVKALIQGEAAIGLGMTAQAVNEISNGAPLQILYFEEGAPFTLYGQSIIKGKETDEAVKAVFDYLIYEYNHINNEKFFPEQIYKDKTYTVKNYPTDIRYADMGNNTIEEKERLLAKWAY